MEQPYDKILTDAGVIFALQSELAQAIAGKFKTTLSQDVDAIFRPREELQPLIAEVATELNATLARKICAG